MNIDMSETLEKPTFTNNWFELTGKHNFRRHLYGFRNKPNLHFLEIGAYEGKATLWMLENILTHQTSKITVLDTFIGSMEHLDESDMFEKFNKNIQKHISKVNVKIGKSQVLLREIKDTFDFVYIDGSHQASDVLEDAILSFRLLKSGGVMIFDDYQWKGFPEDYNNPKLGMDAFREVFRNQIKLIENALQMILVKI